MVRRNRSTSSRHSRNDTGTITPSSPALASTPTGGLARSNTVPSKKSPALPSGRFQRHDADTGIEPLTQIASEDTTNAPEKSPAASSIVPAAVGASGLIPGPMGGAARSQERLLEPPQETLTPKRERNLQSLFQRSPGSDSERRQPNKLKKKRIEGGGISPSAQSSTSDLPIPSAVSPNVEVTNSLDQQKLVNIENQSPPSPAERSTGNTPSEPTPRASQVPPSNTLHPENSLKPNKSPPPSLHSSFNEGSDLDQVDDTPLQTTEHHERERRRRWRLSRQKKDDMPGPSPVVTSPRERAIGSNSNADVSSTSIGSSANKPRKSFTGDSSDPTLATAEVQISQDSSKENKGESGGKDEHKGPLGWIKHKYREAKEEHRRNKSPPEDRGGTHLPTRGKSLDIRREEEKHAQQGPLSPSPPQQQAQVQSVQPQPSPGHPPPVRPQEHQGNRSSTA